MRVSNAPRRLAGALALLLALAVGLLAPAEATPATAAAPGTMRYVATTGKDTLPVTGMDNDCTALATPCLHTQHAITESSDGDGIAVFPGRYVETLDITKTLAITGGYPDPMLAPTIVDAQGLNNSVVTISTTVGRWG